MAISLKLPKLFGAEKAAAAAADLDMPTTQVRAGAQPGYDPLASVSIMEQLRSATSEMRMPKRLPLDRPPAGRPAVPGAGRADGHVPRAGARSCCSSTAGSRRRARPPQSTATEMQMLSQRLARGHRARVAGSGRRVRGAQGQPRPVQGGPRRAAERRHGEGRLARRAVRTRRVVKLLQRHPGALGPRRRRTPSRVIDNQQSLTTLAKGLDNINQGNNAILELAQQAAQQVGQGGGSLREIEYANQLAVLSQRIAKNANALASGEEIDPEVAFLLGKDAGTFRDILNGLLKGSDALRLAGVRNEEARATLAELQKRFAALRPGRRRDPAEHEPARRSPSRRRAASTTSPRRCSPTRRSSPSIRERRPGARRAVGRGRLLRCSRSSSWCCSARSSSTTRACARSRARARTSATRRPFSGC